MLITTNDSIFAILEVGFSTGLREKFVRVFFPCNVFQDESRFLFFPRCDGFDVNSVSAVPPKLYLVLVDHEGSHVPD